MDRIKKVEKNSLLKKIYSETKLPVNYKTICPVGYVQSGSNKPKSCTYCSYNIFDIEKNKFDKEAFCTINKGAGPCGQSFCNMNDLHKYAKYKNMIRNLKSKHYHLIRTKKKRDGDLKFIKTIRTKIFEKIAWQKDADLNYDGIAGMMKETWEAIFTGKKEF